MGFFNQPDWDHKLFDRLVQLGQVALEKGYAKAWFSWIEWVGLTALLFLAFEYSRSLLVAIATLISVFILFFVALAGVEIWLYDFLESKHVSKKTTIAIVVLITLATPFTVMEVISAIFKVSST